MSLVFNEDSRVVVKETNPLVKFIFVFFLSILLFNLYDLIKIYSILILILAYYKVGKFPYNVAKPRIRMMIIFSTFILIVQVLFVHDGKFLFYLIPNISIFGPFIPVYEMGLFNGLLIIGRFIGIIAISWVFVNSTNPFSFARSLIKLKIPYRIAYTMALSLRFAPVFTIETNIIQKAQSARGLNTNPNTFRGLVNLLRYTLIPLIGSTLERIKDITISMEGRGFGCYSERTYLFETPFYLKDLLKLFIGTLLIWIFWFI